MVKCISAILLAAGIAFGASAQTVNEVTLVVSGDGTTKEAATHSALRSAIEQAFGTFVSANTSILNDELIKDEIVSVSSGNIQKYIELSSAILPDGNTSVTLQATVSIGKLISYTQNKGYQCEFAGQTFAMQLKLDRLNYTNAEKAIDHLIDQLKPLIPNMFDFRLKVKAGLTGYAQVNGKYNTTPYDKLKLDLMYIEHYSILMDINLMFKTIKILFMPDSTEGIEDGAVTAGDISFVKHESTPEEEKENCDRK